MTSFDDDERALNRALHGRVDHMNESPLALSDVDARARGIRRRRAAIAGVGLAAAAAIIVPTALVAGGAFDRDDTPPVATGSPGPTGTDGPTATDTPTAPATSDTPDITPGEPQLLDVSDLTTGASPGIAWAETTYEDMLPVSSTIHTDRGSLDLDVPVGQFAALGDDWVVVTYDPQSQAGDQVVRLVDGTSGATRGEWPGSGGLTASAGGGVVAWTTPGGRVMALQPGDTEPTTVGSVPSTGQYRMGGVSGEDCTTDCTVYVLDNSRSQQVFAVSPDGTAPVRGVLGVTAADDEHYVAMTSYDEMKPGSCSRLFTLDGTEVWETCDSTPADIAPGGAYLIGLPAYLDGIGNGSMAILDATSGTAVQSWRNSVKTQAFTGDEAWEDDEHVLAAVHQKGTWQIVRFGADGSMEYAVAPRQDSDMLNPFVLQTR